MVSRIKEKFIRTKFILLRQDLETFTDNFHSALIILRTLLILE